MAKRIEVKAPGRVCLFGDHQDYLGLPVIACAIDRYVTFDGEQIPGSEFILELTDVGEQRRIPLRPAMAEANDHLVSALLVLRRMGFEPDHAYRVMVSGNIPINAGLSSSSALLVGWMRFLMEACGCQREFKAEELARWAYEAEVLEFGSPGGLMDQYTISLGSLVHLDTVTGEHQFLPPPDVEMVVGESGIGKSTLGVLSEKRRIATLAIQAVKARMDQFDIYRTGLAECMPFMKELAGEQQALFEAALENRDITSAAKDLLLGGGDVQELGGLMNAHHRVLKEKLRITLPLIDDMVQAALSQGAYGAKIVGSGLGGCIVALCAREQTANVINAMVAAGAKAAYAVNVGNGAEVI